MKSRLNRKVMTDLLTGLPNRRSLLEQVNLNEADRRSDHSDTALIVTRIDFFKIIRNHYKHRDDILIEVSNRLNNSLNSNATVARWSGNEFLILLPNTDVNKAYGIAEKIRRNIANNPIVIDDYEYDVTATIGVSAYHADDTFEDTLMNTGTAIIPQQQPEYNRVVLVQ